MCVCVCYVMFVIYFFYTDVTFCLFVNDSSSVNSPKPNSFAAAFPSWLMIIQVHISLSLFLSFYILMVATFCSSLLFPPVSATFLLSIWNRIWFVFPFPSLQHAHLMPERTLQSNSLIIPHKPPQFLQVGRSSRLCPIFLFYTKINPSIHFICVRFSIVLLLLLLVPILLSPLFLLFVFLSFTFVFLVFHFFAFTL